MKAGKSNQSRMGLVVAGLMLGIFIAAIDNTIVATAMGTIVGELGGLDKFVWVTSAYMVTEMAGMPIFGKLSDMYGRKRFFMMGLIMFTIGSILCGTAQSIVQLSVYRAIQGIGGGALIPIAFSILFDIFPPEKRGKMGGMFGAVFGTSSIIGPLLGAYITDYLNWRWIFYINIPLAIIAFSLVTFYYRESLQHARQKIDWLGTITLIPAVACLLFALEFGGSRYAWDSGVIISLFAASAILTVAFLVVESKVEEPIISFSMFRERLYASSTFAGLFSGAAMVVASVFIPIYIQGVQGGSATNSGLLLLPMMLSVSVTAPIAGQLCQKMSYRNVLVMFTILFVAGFALLATLTPDTSRWMVTVYMIIAGLGLGASFSVLGMSAIHHFDEKQRGAASSTSSFLRSLGMTVGITIFGIIQRNDFISGMKTRFAEMGGGSAPVGSFKDPREILSPATRGSIPAPVLKTITHALSDSIATTFLWTLIPVVLMFVCVLLMGKDRLQNSFGTSLSQEMETLVTGGKVNA